jgi:hypothetical protein
MIDTRFAFIWLVPRGGYVWQEATPVGPDGGTTPARLLVPKTDDPQETQPLLEGPELFRRLAEISHPDDRPDWGEVPAWEARVQRFADTFGALGVDTLVRLPDGRLARGESLATWHRESYRMRLALEVWDALMADDREALGRCVTETAATDWRTSVFTPDDPWSSAMFDSPVQLVRDELATKLWWAGWSTDPADRRVEWPTDAVQWAFIHLQQWVNQSLESFTSVRMQRRPSSPEKAPFQLAVIPKHLLGACWLQFARAVEGELRYERCAECGTWFRVKPKGNRPTTRFCRDYCRVKANRRPRYTSKTAPR